MWHFLHIFGCILDIFEDFSIRTEKQRIKPQNLNSWKNLASFDTMLVPGTAKVVEIEIISKIVSFEMILRSKIPVCNWLILDYKKMIHISNILFFLITPFNQISIMKMIQLSQNFVFQVRKIRFLHIFLKFLFSSNFYFSIKKSSTYFILYLISFVSEPFLNFNVQGQYLDKNRPYQISMAVGISK